jgi:hypothetical protein
MFAAHCYRSLLITYSLTKARDVIMAPRASPENPGCDDGAVQSSAFRLRLSLLTDASQSVNLNCISTVVGSDAIEGAVQTSAFRLRLSLPTDNASQSLNSKLRTPTLVTSEPFIQNPPTKA